MPWGSPHIPRTVSAQQTETAESLIAKFTLGMAYVWEEDGEGEARLILHASRDGVSYIVLTPEENALLQRCSTMYGDEIVQVELTESNP